MPKTKISEFSATPANNTDIDSINIAEGCAPSGINDAIRELMAQLKDFQTGAVGDSFNGPIGTSTAAAGAFTTLSASSTTTLSGLTASTALALDASKNVVSVTNTGTGNNVLATSPTLVTPILGTPTSATLTNATGLPISTGVSGLGTGVATFLATPSSANLAAALTDETGSGANVFATSPTLVTPVLGTPTSATLTNATGLPLTTGVTGTLPTANGGTNLTSFTSGGVVYASSTSALATGSALTFDGTNFGIGGASAGAALSVKKAKATVQIESTTGTNAAYQNFSNTGTNFYVGIDSSTGSEFGTGAANAGLLWQGANSPIVFAVSNTEQMRLTSTGLGIGTSSPAAKLDVVGAIKATTGITNTNTTTSSNSNLSSVSDVVRTDLLSYGSADSATLFSNVRASYSVLLSQSGNGMMLGTYNSTPVIFGTNNTERMRLDSAGNLGLGVTPSAWQSTNYKVIDVGAVTSLYTDSGVASSLGHNMYIDSTYTYKYKISAQASRYEQYLGAHKWFTAASGTAGNTISFTQAMTLTASGELLVSGTSAYAANAITMINGFMFASKNAAPSAAFDRAGSSDGDAVHFRYNGNTVGSVSVTSSATAYNTSSDYRLKNITGPITTSGAYIDSLNPVEGTWKADGSTFVGLIAHEVQEASRTQVATGIKDGEEMQAIDYSNSELIANLIAEVKSLRQRVATLEAQ